MNVHVVNLARLWIGTPYLHQAAVRGAGCDCLGLIRGVCGEAGFMTKELVPAYSRDWSEPQGDEVLWRAAVRLLLPKPLTDAGPGDVILFRMRAGAVAKHLGIQAEVGEIPTFIHSYTGHGVVENALSCPWQRRIVARFALPQEV